MWLILQALNNYVDKTGDKFVPQYRVYHLDGAGCVTTTEWLDAAGDEAAIDATGNQDIVQCELWQGRRLVTRFATGTSTSPQPIPPVDHRSAATR